MKQRLAFAAAFMLAISFAGCESQIDGKMGKKITKKWFKARAAISDDCKQQRQETLQTVLAELQVSEKSWKNWRQESKGDYQKFKKKFRGAYCKD